MLFHWFRLTAMNRYTAGQPNHSTGMIELSTSTPMAFNSGLLKTEAIAATPSETGSE